MSLILSFENYLRFEKGMADNSVESYLHDIKLFKQFLELQVPQTEIHKATSTQIRLFLSQLTKLGMAASSQARILSGMRSFFNFLVLERLIDIDPCLLVEAPSLGRKLPVILYTIKQWDEWVVLCNTSDGLYSSSVYIVINCVYFY